MNEAVGVSVDALPPKRKHTCACLCEEHHREAGPNLLHESVELFPGGLAARVEVEDELWVERGMWVDGRGEDVVWEGCDEGGERGELFRGRECEWRA